MSITSSSTASDLDQIWRCTRCGKDASPSASEDSINCMSCGASFPIRDGIVIVREQADGNNAICQSFYNSADWPRFRFWEWLTFFTNGGERRSRRKVLRHLPTGPNLKLLDVAIGDGVYLPWLPADWKVAGIDISTVQLDACRKRSGQRDFRLILGEAENLPIRDRQFDAAISIGAFNYFNDPEQALREMARAVKPGGKVVISDEIPNLTDRVVFHKIGLPGVDRWIVRQVTKHLGDDFNAMVERHREMDVRSIGERVLDDCHYELIWMGVGYVLVGTARA